MELRDGDSHVPKDFANGAKASQCNDWNCHIRTDKALGNWILMRLD